MRAVVDAFRAPGVNFLVPELDPHNPKLAPDTYVDISHESLIRQWKKLSEWLGAEGRAAQQWRRLVDRHGTGEMLRGRELANLVAWRAETKPNAAWAKRYGGDYPAVIAFLDKSQRARTTKRVAVIASTVAGISDAGRLRHRRDPAAQHHRQAERGTRQADRRTQGAAGRNRGRAGARARQQEAGHGAAGERDLQYRGAAHLLGSRRGAEPGGDGAPATPRKPTTHAGPTERSHPVPRSRPRTPATAPPPPQRRKHAPPPRLPPPRWRSRRRGGWSSTTPTTSSSAGSWSSASTCSARSSFRPRTLTPRSSRSRKASRSCARCCAPSPDVTLWKDDLAVSLIGVARVHVRREHACRRAQVFRGSRRRRTRVRQGRPPDRLLYNLQIHLGELGDLYIRLGDRERGAQSIRRAACRSAAGGSTPCRATRNA